MNMARGCGRKELATSASLFSSRSCSILPSPLQSGLETAPAESAILPKYCFWGSFLWVSPGPDVTCSAQLVAGAGRDDLRAALSKSVHPRSNCCQLRCESSNLRLLKRRHCCGSLMSSLTKTDAGLFSSDHSILLKPDCFMDTIDFCDIFNGKSGLTSYPSNNCNSVSQSQLKCFWGFFFKVSWQGPTTITKSNCLTTSGLTKS